MVGGQFDQRRANDCRRQLAEQRQNRLHVVVARIDGTASTSRSNIA
jgi:hypothetical protein